MLSSLECPPAGGPGVFYASIFSGTRVPEKIDHAIIASGGETSRPDT